MTWWNVQESSWLRQTGQVWKWRLFVTLVFATVAAGFLWLFGTDRVGGLGSGRVLMGTLVASLLWFAFAFRCSRCGKNVGRWAMSHSSGTEFLYALSSLRECPHCANANSELSDKAQESLSR